MFGSIAPVFRGGLVGAIALTGSLAHAYAPPLQTTGAGCGGQTSIGDASQYLDPTGVNNQTYVPTSGRDLIDDLIEPSVGETGTRLTFEEIMGVSDPFERTVHATSGELRYSVPLYEIPGLTADASIRLDVNYRSFGVDEWGQPIGDPIATVADPFGPGWRASWGDTLVIPTNPSGTVLRYGPDGSTISYSGPVAKDVSFPDQRRSFTNLTYPGRNGSRILLEHAQNDRGQVQATWYREFPNGSRIRYGVVDSPTNLRRKAVFAGDPAAPDWEISYDYAPAATSNEEPVDSTESLAPQTQQPAAPGSLVSITDHRGIQIKFDWIQLGTVWRVSRIRVVGPSWNYAWSDLTTDFQYSNTFPFRLQDVTRPARDFVEDVDRSGFYEATEKFDDARPVTHFDYLPGSGRIHKVYDDSAGATRQWMELAYDSVLYWRVAQQKTGISGNVNPPGSGQRTQVMTYPNTSTLVWTNAIGATRTYIHTTQGQNSPTAWRLSQMTQTASSNDPRPDGYYKHSNLTWSFTWDGQGRMQSVTDPCNLVQTYTWDSFGRDLVTQTQLIGAGGATQTRSWNWSTWNHPDPRLASRLLSFTNANGKSGSIAYTADSTGVTAQHSMAGIHQNTVRENNLGRVVYFEEADFDVIGGGTNARRMSYVIGSDPNSPSFGMVKSLSIDHGNTQATQNFTFVGLGHLASLQDALGRTTTFERDVTDKVVTMTLPTTGTGAAGGSHSAQVTYCHNLRGLLAVVQRPALQAFGANTPYPKATVETQHVYDALGRPWIYRKDMADLNSTNQVWQERRFLYDTADRQTDQYDDSGNRHQLIYDDHDKLYQHRSQVDANTWAERKYGYTACGLLIEEVDATGLVINHAPDEFQRLGRTDRPGGKSKHYFWDNENLVTRIELHVNGALLRTDHRDRDDLGRLTAERVSVPGVTEEVVTTYTWTGNSRLESVTDESGRSVSYEYGGGGGLARVAEDLIAPGVGSATRFLRNLEGDIHEEQFTTYRDTGAGLIPEVRTTRYVFDNWDRPTRVERLGLGSTPLAVSTFAYNSLDQNVYQTDPTGRIRESRKGGTGRSYWNKVTPKPGSGSEPPIVVTASYDDSPSDPNLSLIITKTDGTGKPSQYLVGLDSRLVEERLPGHSLSPRSRVWSYTYDLEQRLTGWVDGNGTDVRLDLNAEKQVARRWVANAWPGLSKFGTEHHFSYDEFGNLEQSSAWWSAFGNSSGPDPTALRIGKIASDFDAFGRLKNETFEFADDGQHNGLFSKQVTHSWTNTDGNQDFDIRRSLDTANGWKMNFDTNSVGAIANVGLNGNGTSLASFASLRYSGENLAGYDIVPGSDATKKLHTQLSSDSLGYGTGQVTRFGTGLATDPVRYSLGVSRDAFGNALDARYAKVDGSAGDWFRIDRIDRLTEAKYGVPLGDFTSGNFAAANFAEREAFHHDSSNNRTSTEHQTSGLPPFLKTYGLKAGTNQYQNIAGQLSFHDGNGNLIFDGTRLYLYDFMDRLSEVFLYVPTVPPSTIPLASYAYDPDGRRLAKIDSKGLRFYTWDGWNVLDELDPAGQALKTWFSNPAQDSPLGYARNSDSGWERFTFIVGLTGSIAAVADSSGNVVERYEYDAFGERTIYSASGQKLNSSSIDNEVGFIGRPHDDTGLVYCRNRYYSPERGRFISLDPTGIWTDGLNFGNGYAYTGNRPTTYSDPTGEIGWLCGAYRALRGPRGGRRGGRGNGPDRGRGRGNGNGDSPGSPGSSRGDGNTPDSGPRPDNPGPSRGPDAPSTPRTPDSPGPSRGPDNPGPERGPDTPGPERGPDNPGPDKGPSEGGRPVPGPGGGNGDPAPSGGKPPRDLDDPESLKGATKEEIEELVEGWDSKPTRHGGGTRYYDPAHPDRTVRIMPGHGRPDSQHPEKTGPYCRVGRGKGEGPHIPLAGNPTLPPPPSTPPPSGPTTGGNN